MKINANEFLQRLVYRIILNFRNIVNYRIQPNVRSKKNMNTPTPTSEAECDTSLLPAWFTERMMHDNWSFALLTTSGKTICIENIQKLVRVDDGSIWIDVTLLADDNMWTQKIENRLVAPTSRTTASINTSHVVAAYEIADT